MNETGLAMVQHALPIPALERERCTIDSRRGGAKAAIGRITGTHPLFRSVL